MNSSSLLSPHVPTCPQDLEQAKKQDVLVAETAPPEAGFAQQVPPVCELPKPDPEKGKNDPMSFFLREALLRVLCILF